MFVERRNGEGSFVGADALKAVDGAVVKRRGVLGFCWYGIVVSFCFCFGLGDLQKHLNSALLWCAYKVP